MLYNPQISGQKALNSFVRLMDCFRERLINAHRQSKAKMKSPVSLLTRTLTEIFEALASAVKSGRRIVVVQSMMTACAPVLRELNSVYGERKW